MWQTEWAGPRRESEVRVPQSSKISLNDVTAVSALIWKEHCVECAIPDCYATCSLYEARRDHKCARFRHGVMPDPAYHGLFPYGAEIEFRRWAKLESKLYCGQVKLDRLRTLARLDAKAVAGVGKVAEWLKWIDPNATVISAYGKLRDVLLERTATTPERFDEFVVEVWNQGAPCDLMFGVVQGNPQFLTSLHIAPGHNLHRIPAAEMKIDWKQGGKFSIWPAMDAEAHLIFTWLDFVRYNAVAREHAAMAAAQAAASTKIKVLVWDLDNTFWKGILAEDGPGAIEVRADARRLMLELDARGILQSIASKNDAAAVLPLLDLFEVSDYFLYPQINWGPKSESIRRLATELNLGLDSFAFIDDSEPERNQVQQAIPELRVYSEMEISQLLRRPEFDVPATEESRNRRAMYLEDSKRKQAAASYSDNSDGFLRSCELKVSVFTPVQAPEIERCLELLQRSNQLNLTTHRYTAPEFSALLQNPNYICMAGRCEDRFGQYGIVAFASVNINGNGPVLTDFVVSCRVARKKMEHAYFHWLRGLLESKGCDRLLATFIPTKRNGMLWDVLNDVGFVAIGETNGNRVLELPGNATIAGRDIANVVDAGVVLPDARGSQVIS